MPLPPKFSLCYFRKWCPNFENGASIFVYGALILKMVPLFSRDANLWRSKIWTFFFYNTPVSNYFLYHYQRMRQRLLRVLSLVSTNPFFFFIRRSFATISCNFRSKLTWHSALVFDSCRRTEKHNLIQLLTWLYIVFWRARNRYE